VFKIALVYAKIKSDKNQQTLNKKKKNIKTLLIVMPINEIQNMSVYFKFKLYIVLYLTIESVSGEKSYNTKYNEIVKDEGGLKTAIDKELPKEAKFFDINDGKGTKTYNNMIHFQNKK
jgi:hypothetical protein